MAEAFYVSNMADDLAFSHNQEWVTAEALAFFNGTSPWFLYANPTAPHSNSPDLKEALFDYELTATPQGTLAERLRAGGAGIPAFYTPTGVGTVVSEGGMPWRYGADGEPELVSPPKEVRRFDTLGRDQEYVLEHGIRADFALVRAARADRHGNLVFARSARNFNPLAAQSARVTIAEVDEIVELGELDADAVHLPGIHVDRIVLHTPEEAAELPIELRTVRSRNEED